MDSQVIPKKINWKWLIIIIAIFLFLAILVSAVYFKFTKEYKDRIYPNVYIGKENVGGLTKMETLKILEKHVNSLSQNGIIFSYLDHKTVLLPLTTSPQGEVTYQLINFDLNKTVDNAYAVGRGLNVLINLKNKLGAGKKDKQIPVEVMIDQTKIKNYLADDFSIYETPAKNAELSYEYDKNNDKYSFTVLEEKSGTVANYDSGLEKLKNNLAKFDNSIITLDNQIQNPTIYKRDCIDIETKVKIFFDRMPITLRYDGEEKIIGTSTLVKWLGLLIESDQITVGLNPDLVKNYLKENIASVVDKKPANSKFTIKNGRVTEFQTNQDGKELDIEASFTKINDALNNNSKEAELVINVIKSEVKDENVNELGIEEIIGTGHSNFSGSSANRRHNIKTGANALNGVLIKPGEEFAVMKTLAPIDATTGYLTELVIKQNKTIPEYGGGLCQIGTTMFRAALASGLPITERRNHSYRVSYYEPAGTDATIYDPWPDLKFVNDTNNYILIQARIEGNDLYFDFWGKKDGRMATTTYPKIYNIVKPPAVKIVETLDLKPGVKKCTEKAHNGADAYFNYTVTYPTGEVKEEKFSSHYVPWQEVCLMGVEKLSNDKAASSSAINIINEKLISQTASSTTRN